MLVETSIHYSKLLGVTRPTMSAHGAERSPSLSDDLIITPPTVTFNMWTGDTPILHSGTFWFFFRLFLGLALLAWVC